MNYCYIPDKNYKTCVKIPNINARVPGKYCFPQTKDTVALNNCKNGIDNDNKYDPKCTFSDPKYTKEILSHECGIANGAENYCGNKPEQQQCRTDFTGHCEAWNFCQDIHQAKPGDFSTTPCTDCLKTKTGKPEKNPDKNTCYLGTVDQIHANICNLPENVYIPKKNDFCCVGNFDKSKCELHRDSNLITKLKDANGNIQCIKNYYGCRWDCSTSPPTKVPVGNKPPPGFIGCYETLSHCQSKI